jgi:hypothetical protein
MKSVFSFVLLGGALILCGFSTRANAQEAKNVNPPHCQVIRVVAYPVTQRADKNVKKRIALLNLCPENRGAVARPMLPVETEGKFRMFEYEVVRVFKNRKDAEKYAKQNNIADVNF